MDRSDINIVRKMMMVHGIARFFTYIYDFVNVHSKKKSIQKPLYQELSSYRIKHKQEIFILILFGLVSFIK